MVPALREAIVTSDARVVVTLNLGDDVQRLGGRIGRHEGELL